MSDLDLSLPVILGTGWFAPDAMAAVDASIAAYLDAGGLVLDTARIYGPSEEVIGDWLRRHGDVPGLQLVTKGGHPDPAVWAPRLGRDEVLADARTSIGKLGRPADLYLLHRDDPATPVEEVAETLKEVVDEGLARSVGVSNWGLARTVALREALRARALDLAVISNYAGLAVASGAPAFAGMRSLDAETLAWIEENAIPELAWSSQSGGYFAGIPTGTLFDGPENVRRRAALDRVASAAGARPVDVLARWTATASPVIVPLVASRSSDRLAHLIASTQNASLDPVVDELIAAIDPGGEFGRALIRPDVAW